MEYMRNREDANGKMIVFDMENVLLQEKFIDVCAAEFKFQQALSLLRQIDNDPASLIKRTAAFLKDQKKSTLMEIAAGIALVPGIVEAVQELKERSYIVGMISDSYQVVAGITGKKIGADFELANELQFIGNHVTGDVLIPSYFSRSPESTCRHPICKTNALRHICRVYQTKFENCTVIAGSDEDACMLGHAGLGIAYCSSSETARNAARQEIRDPELSGILTLVP